MDSMRNRAKDMFPMVLLTLLSIVQALALEFLWDHVRHRPDLLELSVAVIPGWLQAAVVLNVIIIIWLMYAGLLMRFRWTPSTADSVFPFLVGLVQFLLIDLMGTEHFSLWIVVLALTFGALLAIDHRAMKRARADAANSEFFENILPATIRDFIPQMLMFGGLLLAAAWIGFYEYQNWRAALVLVAVLIGLAYEIRQTAYYWAISMKND